MAIYDCFQFFNEEHILDLRLNILNEFVDFFVIVESTTDHQGNSKKLNFDSKKFKKSSEVELKVKWNLEWSWRLISQIYTDPVEVEAKARKFSERFEFDLEFYLLLAESTRYSRLQKKKNGGLIKSVT